MNAKQIVAVGLVLGVATGLGYHLLTRPARTINNTDQPLKPLASFDLQPMELPKQDAVAVDAEPTNVGVSGQKVAHTSQITLAENQADSSSDFALPALEDPASNLSLDEQMTSDSAMASQPPELVLVQNEDDSPDLDIAIESPQEFASEAALMEQPVESPEIQPAQETPQLPVVIKTPQPTAAPQRNVWKSNPFTESDRGQTAPMTTDNSNLELESMIQEEQNVQPATAESSDLEIDDLPLEPAAASRPLNSVMSMNDPRWNLPVSGPAVENFVAPPQVAPATAVRLSETDAQKAVHHIEYGKELSRRGAGFSAREEFLKAIQVIVTANDRQSGSNQHSAALREAMKIMTEAEQFEIGNAEQQIRMNLVEVVRSHQSKILSPSEAAQLTPSQAIDRYFHRAQKLLDFAGGRNVVTAEAYYCLGKLHSAVAATKQVAGRIDTAKSVVFHQSALASDSKHHRAANELGVLFAKNGRVEESKTLFQRSLTIQPHPQTWRNLAIAHQRLGEQELAAQANNEFQILANNPIMDSSIDWLPIGQFNLESPYQPQRVASAPTEPVTPQQQGGKSISQRLKDLF